MSALKVTDGGVDPGESPIRALHREVLEETGWTISIQRRLGAFQRYTFMPEYDLWARKVCAVYLCRPNTSTGWRTPERRIESLSSRSASPSSPVRSRGTALSSISSSATRTTVSSIPILRLYAREDRPGTGGVAGRGGGRGGGMRNGFQKHFSQENVWPAPSAS
ncbi:hypothetical protein CNY89_19590 [Amaricoccus sp. HAR-UPW-R2A-40]|nr:hypothetical protein CNY89_19590 [Amaricoccus sp. HAR-UPW-R2A-40]